MQMTRIIQRVYTPRRVLLLFKGFERKNSNQCGVRAQKRGKGGSVVTAVNANGTPTETKTSNKRVLLSLMAGHGQHRVLGNCFAPHQDIFV